jgi:phosphate-selective porin OprO/OprP
MSRSLRTLTPLVLLLLFIAGNVARGQEVAPFVPYDPPAEFAAQPVDYPVRLTAVEADDATPAPAPSEGPYADYFNAPSDADRLSAMEKKFKDLEKQVKANAPKKPQPGEWEDLSQEKWNVKMGGHVQMDYINWAQASPQIQGDDNYFEFRRLRLTADGTGYGVYDFRLQMTLEPDAISDQPNSQLFPNVKDAYFSINELPILGRLRIGNFFVPFGLEQVTNDTMNIFLERSIPTQNIFTADREVGIATYNWIEDRNITWAGGVFFDNINDAQKVRIDDNQGYRASGRVTWLPYYDEPSNGRYLMHTGAGVMYTDDQDNLVRFRARPQIHQGPRLLDTGNLNANAYTIGNLEWAVVHGPITVQSEAYVTSVNDFGPGTTTLNGAYAHISYFVTGENRNYERFGQHGAQFGRPSPFSNVFAVPGFRSWGALELKARWSHLDFNSINRGQYNDYTFGFNWYWSDRVRLMFDYIHPITSSDAVFGAVNADIIGMRWDFNW